MSLFETARHVRVRRKFFFLIFLSVFSLEVPAEDQHEDLRRQELAWPKTACEELALQGRVTLETEHYTAHSAHDSTALTTRKQHLFGCWPVW